jgi:sensor histidine kinase YesM
MGESFAIPASNPFFTFILQQKEIMDSILLKTSSALNIFIIIYGIFYSHRIFGPILRFRLEINKINSIEDLCKIQLRKKDYFKEVADEYNQMVTRVTQSHFSSKK